ncbi:thioesterase family protein [Deinococcus sp. AJ005]|uniref:acyl-CoA thioesterase n=1 Tax=Deinococcus sp. AJ005 TaxID=2652443 RepID=UPI00125CCC85|nr:thioesterase family protein [Deinococcus sp. AJ005]QFP75634.1 acyl-CoA thioesterase [Deinococcus sp. AJ005]
MTAPASPAPAPSASRIPALNWHDAHRTSIQLRFADVDAMGHVNNARYAEFLEVARMDMSAATGIQGDDDHSMLARLELDYVHEIRLGQTVFIESLVERVGRSSWTVAARFVADNVPCAFARSVQVRVNADHIPEALPERFHELVKPLLARLDVAPEKTP